MRPNDGSPSEEAATGPRRGLLPKVILASGATALGSVVRVALAQSKLTQYASLRAEDNLKVEL